MKKFKRIFLIFVVLISITQLNSTICLAVEDVEMVRQFARVDDGSGGDSKQQGSESEKEDASSTSTKGLLNPKDYDPKPDEVNPGGKYNKKVGVILGIIRAVGIVSSVIALMIIGIRMMTLSIEEKAIYKESLPGYIFGVVMVVAFSVIPSIIYDIFIDI